jgi:hypothetical protein
VKFELTEPSPGIQRLRIGEFHVDFKELETKYHAIGVLTCLQGAIEFALKKQLEAADSL